MILITNEQTDIEVNVRQLQYDAQIILDDLRYNDFDLGILLCTTDAMHDYNKKYRGKDKATDILSFPYHDTLQAGEKIEPESDDDKNVGDIILCPQYIMDDLDRWNMSFEPRLQVLLVHGICHLLGYDHIDDDDYELMKKEEQRLLNKLS